MSRLVPPGAGTPNGNGFLVLHRPPKQHCRYEKNKPANGRHRQQSVKDDEESEGEQRSCNEIQLLWHRTYLFFLKSK
jgi:hypothetical protein